MASFVSQLSSAEFYGLPCLMKGNTLYMNNNTPLRLVFRFFFTDVGGQFPRGQLKLRLRDET